MADPSELYKLRAELRTTNRLRFEDCDWSGRPICVRFDKDREGCDWRTPYARRRSRCRSTMLRRVGATQSYTREHSRARQRLDTRSQAHLGESICAIREKARSSGVQASQLVSDHSENTRTMNGGRGRTNKAGLYGSAFACLRLSALGLLRVH